MVLDRAADSPSAPTLPTGVTSLVFSHVSGLYWLTDLKQFLCTELLGFDGIVLEVTDIGDVLTVMMF